MSSTRSTAAKDELTASETLIAISMSPKKKDAKNEATAYTKTNPGSEILPASKSSATTRTSSRSLFSPHMKGGASASSSIVTPKSTIKTPRVTRNRSAAARAVSGAAASRIAAVENSATKPQVKTEADPEEPTNVNNGGASIESPIFRRNITADNSSTAIKPSEAYTHTKIRDLTSPSNVVLPLLTLRSAYNDNAHEREQQQQQSEAAAAASSMSSTTATTTTNNDTHIHNGVASYVEQAAEEDIKTKLLMEINDLKQLLSGRKAQVKSLTAANTNLEEKVHRLQGMERQNKKMRLSSRSPTPTTRKSPTPTRFVGEEKQVKIGKGMQLEELKEEAVARGLMDADSITSMSREALLETLVIGTTCITKSSAWAEVLSLRAEIESEKVAMHLQEEDEKQRLLEMEKKREQKRERRAQQQVKKEQDEGAATGTAFTRDGMEALETATKTVCKSELKKDAAAAILPAKRTRGRPRKFGKKPSFGTHGSAFGIVNRPLPSNSSEVMYPSLAAEEDEKNTHPSHAIIRRDILEAFVTVAPKEDEDLTGEGKKKTARRRRYAGKVGFRCRYCKDKHVEEQGDLSVIYPESIKGLYRANIRFQSKHIQACQYIPQELRDQLEYLKTCKEGMNRGNKNYWTESALRKGFRDWQTVDGEKKGIIYCPELNEELKSSGTH
ncbi:hypothetical protein QTG54_007808 [Skeletonema marinoi]|uniref:Uncharacterized protein n=1 Tax=Skeletonema marinoi TaxID=267567 RepID=A0AAD9DD37_9STRA|nr:hypothetical protein QTG54_007808 [Skeletonema marinoi]